MDKITFQMAQELGLIPRLSPRVWGSQPFESAYATEKRENRQELGYRAELDRIKVKYKYVHFRGETLEVV